MVNEKGGLQEGVLNVYNVNIQGRQTKAADLWSLREFIMLKEKTMSILKVNIARLPEGTSIASVQAQAFQEAWFELRSMIDESLGIAEPVIEEQEPEVVQEVVKPKVVKQQERPPVKTQNKPSGPDVNFFSDDEMKEGSDDDMVTL